MAASSGPSAAEESVPCGEATPAGLRKRAGGREDYGAVGPSGALASASRAKGRQAERTAVMPDVLYDIVMRASGPARRVVAT